MIDCRASPKPGATENKPESSALRLVSWVSNRSHVLVDKLVQHIIIGWGNVAGTVKTIENELPPLVSPLKRCR